VAASTAKDLRLYDVTAAGLVLGNTLYDYRGIMTGVTRRHPDDESEHLSARESIVLRPGDEAAPPPTSRLASPLERPDP
jgi:hypothetical protein